MKQQLGTQWWHVVVDRQDKTPPYLQIAATIRHKISTGELPPGTPLPSVRQLMKISGVTSTTVTRSYHLLQGEGLISIQPGVGATVEGAYKLPAKRKDKVSEDIVTQIDEFIHQMLRQGVTKDKLETVILRQIQKATSARYVVYTTAEAVVSKHYASAINSELSDLGVPCIPVPLASILRINEETKRLIQGAEHVFTALPIFREVEEHIGQFTETPVSHLLTQITLSTHERLQAIAPEARIALVIQRRYRTSAHGLLLTYVAPERINVVRSSTKANIASAIKEADVVVHTVGTRSLVQSALNQSSKPEVIEMEYAIRPDVLATIRELL